MSDAIRDVTIRVKIEQVPGGAAIKSPELREQVSAFESIAEAAAKADIAQQSAAKSARDQAAALSLAEQASDKMVQQAMLKNRDAQAANWAAGGGDSFGPAKNAKATREAAAATKQLSTENITGATNALRAAAASQDLTGVIAGLGQAMLFSAKSMAEQSQAAANVASSAGTAAKAAGGMAAGTAAAGTAAAGMSAILPPLALAVGAVTIAIELGTIAWKYYSEASRTAADDIRDAVTQRLDAERQSWIIEESISAERQKRLGSERLLVQKRTEAYQRYFDVRKQITAVRDESFDKKLSLETDVRAQRQMLGERITEDDRGRLRSAADLVGVRFGSGKGAIDSRQLDAAIDGGVQARFRSEGTDLVKDEKNRLTFLKEAEEYRRREIFVAERVLTIERQQLQAEIEKRDASKARLATIQEMINAEQGRLQSAQERFAQMDPGEQARLKQISAKAKGGGELSLQEAQALSQSGLGGDYASRTFSRIAEKQGFNEVASNLGEFNQINQLRFQSGGESEKVKEAESRIRAQQDEVNKAADSLIKLVATAEKIAAAIVPLISRVEELDKKFSKVDESRVKAREPGNGGIYGAVIGKSGVNFANSAISALKGL